MFSTNPCTVSPLVLDLTSRRRSKSLDDFYLDQESQKQYQHHQQDRLWYYNDAHTPTSPIVAFAASTNSINELPKRRHSLYAGTNDMECLRLANIYGWVTTSKDTIGHSLYELSSPIPLSNHKQLQTSRSFSHLPIPSTGNSKLTKILGRKNLTTTTNPTFLFPNKAVVSASACSTSAPSLPISDKHTVCSKPAIFPISKSINNNNASSSSGIYSNGTTGSDNCGLDQHKVDASPPPTPPIENDPHVFDLLSKDSSHFIHYDKSDNYITSATVEKLVEKLTREIDCEFLMDFFLTFRQFMTPIKLCKLLMARFRWALLEVETDERKLIRIRTFVVIRHWLTHHWTFDFMSSKTLRFMLSTFLTQLQSNPTVLASPRDQRIIKSLRNVIKRQRRFYASYMSPTEYSTINSISNEQEKKENDEQSLHQQQSRKDSAIGIISCRNSMETSNKNKEQKHSEVKHGQKDNWTTRMRRSIQKTDNRLVMNAQNYCNNACCSMHNNQQPYCRSLFSYLTLTSPHSSQHRSIILKYKSEIIVQQFCMIEKAMLQGVTWHELVELRWKKNKRSSIATEEEDLFTISPLSLAGVDRMIGFFNMTCQWVASEIVQSQHLETRVKTIEKFIRIALKCYHHRNYSTLMQILLGLQSPAVSRLERTWLKVDSSVIGLFTQLKEMAKPFKNWKNMRDCMTKAAEDVAEGFAVESILTNSLKEFDYTNGCIPFLGLYLSDLVFVAELPTFIESGYSDTSDDENYCEYDHDDKELCERLSNKLVNYNKYRITASVIKHVLAFQVLSRAYNFKVQNKLFSQLQSMSLLDNSQIRKASFLCET